MTATGWVPIPQVAIAAVGRDGRAAVLELYERAHRTGYAPRPWTERELAEEWGADRRLVVRVLERLVSVGAVVIERAPAGARRPSTLMVLPAVVEDDVHQTRRQTRRQTPHQNASQNSSASAPLFGESAPVIAPDPAPVSAPDPAPARAEIFERASVETETEIRSSSLREERAPPASLTLDRYGELAAYYATAVQEALGRKPIRPTQRSSRSGKRLAVAARQDADAVLDAMRFVAHSQSSRARFLRGEEPGRDGTPYDGLSLETVLRHVDDYAELWRAEQAGARPRARGEHSSSRAPRPTEAEVLARDPLAYDDIFDALEAP